MYLKKENNFKNKRHALLLKIREDLFAEVMLILDVCLVSYMHFSERSS